MLVQQVPGKLHAMNHHPGKLWKLIMALYLKIGREGSKYEENMKREKENIEAYLSRWKQLQYWWQDLIWQSRCQSWSYAAYTFGSRPTYNSVLHCQWYQHKIVQKNGEIKNKACSTPFHGSNTFCSLTDKNSKEAKCTTVQSRQSCQILNPRLHTL